MNIHLDQVEAELAHLTELDVESLKARWLALKGVPLPKFMRRGLMMLAVGYAIQEAAIGGVDAATRKRLDTLAAQIVPTGQKPPPKPNKVKIGTRLIREWQGRVHEVTVIEGGFAWKGEPYPSLSVIARQITGTRWNGWVFFGLKKRPPKDVAQASTIGARVKAPGGPTGKHRRLGAKHGQGSLAESGGLPPHMAEKGTSG